MTTDPTGVQVEPGGEGVTRKCADEDIVGGHGQDARNALVEVRTVHDDC